MVGTPHANNYTLGRGEVSFSPFIDAIAQQPQGFRYVGNTPDFMLNVATTDLDHFQSDHGLKTRDLSVTLEINRTAGFTTDDISLDNVALFFFGTKVHNVTQVGNVAAEPHNNVVPDTTIILGITSATPAGQRNLSAVTSVTDDGAQPKVFAAGTDYTADLATGELYIVPNFNGGQGTITKGTNLRVTYAVAALANDQVLSSNQQVEGAIKFKAFNATGAQIDYFIPWVRLSPDGEYNLKGDAWQALKFKIMILDPKDGRQAVYANGRPYASTN